MAITIPRTTAQTTMGNQVGMSASINFPNLVATGDSFHISCNATITNYVYNGGTYGQTAYQTNSIFKGNIVIDGITDERGAFEFERTSALSLPKTSGWSSKNWAGTIDLWLPTSRFFKASNKTTKTLNITLKKTEWSLDLPDLFNDCSNLTETAGTGSATITLDVPPTATVEDLTFSTPTYKYAGLTTAYVNVKTSGAYGGASYGGDITTITFTIGTQSVSLTDSSITGDDTLSIPLNYGGSFEPTITITDSRGQLNTYRKTQIDVSVYTPSSAVVEVERTYPTGAPYDEGENAVVSATLTFDSAIAHVEEPSVSVTDDLGDTSTPTSAWYATRNPDGTLSGALTQQSDWDALSTGVTVYALLTITDGFDPNKTYLITITPNDDKGGAGTSTSQTLSTAFFTIDFLAGGHGIAFGQPSSQTGFYVNMDTHLLQDLDVTGGISASDEIESLDAYIDLPEYSTSGTTDKEIHDALQTMGWKNDVAPNDTPMSVKKFLAKLINVVNTPRIVEQGTSGIWTYRKWSDGTAECWGVHADSIAITSTWGSIYWGQLTGIPNFPTQFTFQYNPLVEMSTMATSGNAWSTGNLTALSTTNCGTLVFFSAAKQTSITVRANLHAIGKWQ